MIYQILDEPISEDEIEPKSDIPQTLQDFMADIKQATPDAKAFALKLRQMVYVSLITISTNNNFYNIK